jgi:periplasmic divalent cation tolerance protein
MTASSAAVVLVTAGSEEQAHSIGRTLVDERLAACVNVIGPVRSIYRWRDAVEEETEYILMIKTRARLYKKLERRVKELHTYEVPEILALPAGAGSGPYLEWLRASTAAPSRRRGAR